MSTQPRSIKKMVVKSISGHDQGILNPRDLQVSNIKKRVDKANRLSHDDLYNLVELTYHLSDFLRNVTIFPDLLCMAASSNLLQELDRISTEPVTLFYDTTFNIGDIYVSPLTVKHMLFKNNLSIPVAFLIHERKYQRHHELFFETLSELVSSLRKCTAVLVTDREKGITNAIHKVLPGISIVLYIQVVYSIQ